MGFPKWMLIGTNDNQSESAWMKLPARQTFPGSPVNANSLSSVILLAEDCFRGRKVYTTLNNGKEIFFQSQKPSTQSLNLLKVLRCQVPGRLPVNVASEWNAYSQLYSQLTRLMILDSSVTSLSKIVFSFSNLYPLFLTIFRCHDFDLWLL